MQGPVRGNALVGVSGGPGAATDPERAAVTDLNRRELVVLAPLVLLIVVLGVYPKPVLDVVGPSVTATMSAVGATDPVPAQEGK
jgi:NADH-quinone oxidoreductase subunit M